MKVLNLSILLTLILFCQSGFASLAPLLNEFKRKNLHIKNLEDQVETTLVDKNSLEATRTWELTGGTTYVDNEQDFASVFTNNIKTTTYSLGISKKFNWGGEFSLSNQLTNTDRSGLPAFQLGDNPKVINEFVQTLSYSQNLWRNFFGREFYADLNIAGQNIKVAKSNKDREVELKLGEFFSNLVEARLSKTLVYYQEQALKRAKKRKSIIQKRVKDGLNDRVDLYQSQASLLQQRESLKEAEVRYVESLEKLGALFHRKIEDSEIKILPVKGNLPTFSLSEGEWKKNKSLKVLKDKYDLINKRLKKAELGFAPNLSLSGSVAANDINEKSKVTLSRGTVFNNDKEYTVSLNLTMPLGFEAENATKQKEVINKKIAEREIEILQRSLELQEKTILSRLDSLYSNINLSKQRRDLSLKTLQGQNRLYGLGRSDLDRVINAEENLIITERSLVNYLASYFKILAMQADLRGEIVSFVDTFKY